ncbi:hypothetical protein CP965_00895 [Halarcobacter mediterraneus]|uniref:Uncharacterized protein n=1 Tax=Halarcobacter mediterraneus TaxID=2023153 RepID=A0A4Q1AWE2_9BACT|nr:hypothetical protein [Halarcobacter mediterraneus]RXK14038.1 hypothetical protein CP965_00895 [Halarcobacter mediterraneus]
MLPVFIIGGVALAATGFGLRKYVQENDKQELLEDAYIGFTNWGDNLGRKIADFGDSFFENKDEEEPKDSIEKFDELSSIFFEHLIPMFLETYGSFKNLPELEMKQFYTLESEANYNLFKITDKSKIELDSCVSKFAKGIYAVKVELEEIKLLCNGNNNFKTLSKSTKKKIKNTHLLMIRLIKIYNHDIIDEDGQLLEQYIRELDEIKIIADKII